MMKRLLFLAAVLVAAPAVSAQSQFTFDSVFPGDTLDTDGNGMHGVAVDRDGKVFLQPFGGTFAFRFPGGDDDSVLIGTTAYKQLNIRQIFVFNADGTANDTLTYLNGAVQDTLGLYKVGVDATSGRDIYDTRSGRGLRYCEAENAVYVSQFDTIYKINAETLEAEAKLLPFGANVSLGQVGVDDECNVYANAVVGGNPIRIYSPDLDGTPTTVTDASSTFSRGVTASPDGNTVFETDFENTYTIVHQRADEFSDFDSLGVTFRGMRTESAAFQPETGYLWASSGNNLNVPNDSTYSYRWSRNTWYAFRMDDIFNEDGTVNEEVMPRDSLKANLIGGGRPRGIAFTQDGKVAYTAFFNSPGVVQKFVSQAVEVEQRPGEALAFALEPNQPNPFTGTTTIPFSLKEAGHATLRILDTTGREVATLADEAFPSGNFTATFDASALAAGVYIYTLDVEGERMSRRMLVVR